MNSLQNFIDDFLLFEFKIDPTNSTVGGYFKSKDDYDLTFWINGIEVSFWQNGINEVENELFHKFITGLDDHLKQNSDVDYITFSTCCPKDKEFEITIYFFKQYKSLTLQY